MSETKAEHCQRNVQLVRQILSEHQQEEQDYWILPKLQKHVEDLIAEEGENFSADHAMSLLDEIGIVADKLAKQIASRRG